MENYEKKYKDALETLKLKMKNFKEIIISREDIEEIFPEIRESDGERIRKRIILALKHGDVLNLEEITEAIAWLEKQGEQKPLVIDEGKAEMDYCFTKMMNGEKVSSAWSEEDTFKVQRICKYLDEAKKYYADIIEVRECMDWLKSLKERMKGE